MANRLTETKLYEKIAVAALIALVALLYFGEANTTTFIAIGLAFFLGFGTARSGGEKDD